MRRGIDEIRYHNRIGHRSYLLGEIGSRGWWYYYLVALAVKTPLPLLVVGLCGIGLLLRASARERGRPAGISAPRWAGANGRGETPTKAKSAAAKASDSASSAPATSRGRAGATW